MICSQTGGACVHAPALTDAELWDLRAEAERYPECIECRVIRRLIVEIERLNALACSDGKHLANS